MATATGRGARVMAAGPTVVADAPRGPLFATSGHLAGRTRRPRGLDYTAVIPAGTCGLRTIARRSGRATATLAALMGRALVLNASDAPLAVVSARRAVVLVLKEKAEVVTSNGLVFHSERLQLEAPSVVRLRHFVK